VEAVDGRVAELRLSVAGAAGHGAGAGFVAQAAL